MPPQRLANPRAGADQEGTFARVGDAGGDTLRRIERQHHVAGLARLVCGDH